MLILFLQKIDKKAEVSFSLIAEAMKAKICVGKMRRKINYFLNSCVFLNVLSVWIKSSAINFIITTCKRKKYHTCY